MNCDFIKYKNIYKTKSQVSLVVNKVRQEIWGM